MAKKKIGDAFKDLSYLKTYIKYFNLIVTMVFMVLVGTWGGIQLDKWLKTENSIFTIIFTILTAILAVFYLFRTLLKK